MNLVLCNMSNALDWKQGIVNRNYFVMRELVRSQDFDNILLVDFLAVNPVGMMFGKRRTARYLLKSLVMNELGPVLFRPDLLHVVRSFSLFDDKEARMPKVSLLSGYGRPAAVVQDLASLKKTMDRLGFERKNTILWSYNAFIPELLTIDAALHVFDAVDDWSQHASYTHLADRLKSNYKMIDAGADLVFTVSDGLRERFSSQKTSWVPNGVDVDLFTKRPQVPSELADVKHPVVGYVGTVQERLDFDLIGSLCERMPEAAFVFVGPVWAGVEDKVRSLTARCGNIHFLGRRPYARIPDYLACMDVAIIPHRLDAFIQSTNPMKMYDYLAAGKPVVTTPGAGTEAFADCIDIVSSAEDFERAIRKNLRANNDERIAFRKNRVSSHTWKARVRQMRDAVKHAMV